MSHQAMGPKAPVDSADSHDWEATAEAAADHPAWELVPVDRLAQLREDPRRERPQPVNRVHRRLPVARAGVAPALRPQPPAEIVCPVRTALWRVAEAPLVHSLVQAVSLQVELKSAAFQGAPAEAL